MIKLHGYYQNGALIQRNKPICVTGRADGSVKCTLKGGEYFAETTAEPTPEGDFAAVLPPCNDIYNSFTLTAENVEKSGEKLVYIVFFGDVILALGQSNMSYCVGAMCNREEILAEAAKSNVRSLDIFEGFEKDGSIHRPAMPLKDFAKDWKWSNGKSEGIRNSSGVGIQTLLKIWKKRHVPLGIVNTSLGGISIDSYLPREAVERNTAVKTFLVETGKYIPADGEYNIYGGGNYTQMCGMFNEKIAPLLPFSFAAILWYQGENSVSGFKNGLYYAAALEELIRTYKSLFEDIPFIATHIALDYYPYGPDGYNYINEAIDIAAERGGGISFPAYDASTRWLHEDGALYYHPIHPVDKRLIASRFAKILDNRLYGEGKQIPPYIGKQKTCGNDIILTVFPESAKLRKNDCVFGFTIAGADGKFVQAEAEIVACNIVRVFSPYVQSPQEVTYAFARYNDRCNLKTTDGMAVKPYRTKRDDMEKREYFQLNAFGNCDTLFAAEKYFGADLGCIGEPKIWQSGLITRTNSVKIKLVRADKKKILAVKFCPTNKGYYFFGVSPEINLAGYDAHLERFKYLTVRLKSTANNTEFHGVLFRTEKGKIYRLTGEDRQKMLDEDWKEYTVSLSKFITGDLAEVPAEKTALERANQLEFYFRSKEEGTLYIDWVRLHD